MGEESPASPVGPGLLGDVASSPNEAPFPHSSDADQALIISTQRSPPASPETQRSEQSSQPSSPTSPTSRNPAHEPLYSSPSPSLEFGPPRRIDSILRQVKVVLFTSFENRPRRRETLDLPLNQTPEKTYKYIEGTAKQIESQEGFPNDKELCLDDGTCRIICRKHNAKLRGKCPLPEEHRLESKKDWAEIEALLQNYEPSHSNPGDLIIEINRTLKTITKSLPMADDEGARVHWAILNCDIWQKMVKVKGGRNEKYMPNDTMENFMTEGTIRGLISEQANSLGDDVDEITERILHEAPKLILIFVYCRTPLAFLKTLIYHNINDKSLPLPEGRPPWLQKVQDTHTRDYQKDVDFSYYQMIREDQWKFQAVVFDKVFDEHKILDPNAIVPFRSKVIRAEGAYSVVYKIELEASHQRLYHLPNDANPKLALKEVRNHPTSAAASANERLLLKGLRDLGHDHIIRLLASYEQDGKYYFVFPLADFSLEELMRTDPEGLDYPESPKHRSYVAWILGQFAGIASGLAKVHMRSNGSDGGRSSNTLSPELLDPSVARDRRPLGSTGYHHDIKPQNLLYFKKVADTASPCPKHGILQIADFGIGKFHSLMSGTGTRNVRGTPTYAAPESKIPSTAPNGKDAEPGLKLSRPYDVWSLGCVLMEVLVWLVYGTKGWNEFNHERSGRVDENDLVEYTDGYFYLHNAPNRVAKVRESVTTWMNKLEKHPRLKDNPDGSLANLLRLIREHVLIVDPNRRIRTKELTDKLEEIAKTALREAGGGDVTHQETSYNEDGCDSISSAGTPAVTLEYDAPDSATSPSLGSDTRKRSITEELVKPRPGSPGKQLISNGIPRSTLPVRRLPNQATGHGASPLQISSTPPRQHYPPPSRTSTGVTTSGLSTIVEPTTSRTDDRYETGR